MKTLDYIEISDEACLTGICAANMNTTRSLASALATNRFNDDSIPLATRQQMHDAYVTAAVSSKAIEQLLRSKYEIVNTEGVQSDRIASMLDPAIKALNDELTRARKTLKINIDALPYYWAD